MQHSVFFPCTTDTTHTTTQVNPLLLKAILPHQCVLLNIVTLGTTTLQAENGNSIMQDHDRYTLYIVSHDS
jgi:hypothetical protein